MASRKNKTHWRRWEENRNLPWDVILANPRGRWTAGAEVEFFEIDYGLEREEYYMEFRWNPNNGWDSKSFTTKVRKALVPRNMAAGEWAAHGQAKRLLRRLFLREEVGQEVVERYNEIVKNDPSAAV